MNLNFEFSQDHVKEWLTLNTTKEEFELVVENICKSTGKYKEECQTFFKNYGTEIYQIILDDLDSQDFCERVGVCNGTKIFKSGSEVEGLKISNFPAFAFKY
jgi:saposin-like type B protein